MRTSSRPYTAAAIGELSIENLERRFAKFRREHPARARIPDTLRGAVLAAMRQGVTPSQLRRHCGVSPQQIERWQRRRPTSSAMDARVFTVTDDVEGPDAAQIELRIDGWSIYIRRADG